MWLCIFFTIPPGITAAEYEPDAVKAAFLHRFGAYVEWPDQAMQPGTPFTIAVLNNEAVAKHLQQLLPGLSIQGRRAEVRSVAHAREADGVHILYIAGSQPRRTRALANAVADSPVLVVTDQDDGLSSGGVINFVQLGRNIRFEVSLRAARRHGLQIDSGLLSVAVRVEDSPRGARDEHVKSLRFAHKRPHRKQRFAALDWSLLTGGGHRGSRLRSVASR